ncbi:tRNA-dihydrouridine(20a/20b) synthase [NAD(P)+]-like [Mya arenaria]|uniref:tRNA-dihydrouridine(20a/20b) synthase [NAD(P)+]-like n=1 Tax=Mya arenaria TaxID=6604 RepID=UPI0022DEB7B2|nr:tRNA-dihydrouridine(20a/20b) synthase [NAD(P)+]-like [Mya arenaria]
METIDGDEFTWKRPMELFEENEMVKICAPMVRYSKLPFRMLVRKYGCDLAFTPMIIANSFVESLKARDIEFTTCREDRPLIVQFAAHNDIDFGNAAEIVAPYSDGVDLNCGCPQRWAMADGYGACLIHKPNLVQDIVRQARNRVPRSDFTVSVKIRIHEDIRETVEYCKKMEAAGVSFLSVHGRTKDQRNQPVNLEAVRLIQENVGVPVVANGDIKSMEDVDHIRTVTGAKGAMCARGILANPAMFVGYDNTPLECIKDWIHIAMEYGTPFSAFHHHVMYMCERIMSKSERRIFNSLPSTAAVLDYLSDNYDIKVDNG